MAHKRSFQQIALHLLIIPSLLNIAAHTQASFELELVRKLDTYTKKTLAAEVITDLEKLASSEIACTLPELTHIPPLFEEFPELQKTVPYQLLGIYPTPLRNCEQLSAELGVLFFVKEDGKAGPISNGKPLFSGNKVRKLEFLLGHAKAHGCTAVITRGATGSNHALATTVYARELGIQPICLLMYQPNAKSVQRNLLLQAYYKAKLRVARTRPLHFCAMADEFMAYKEETGRFPYLIPTGGSCERGSIGFVNAIFELKKQLTEKKLEEPDAIFVTIGFGSGGTSAGLYLGLKALALKSHLYAASIEPKSQPGELEQQTKKLFEETNALLCTHDENFPHCAFSEDQFTIIRGFEGGSYGLFTQEGMEAKKLFKEKEDIALDGTYTAKACAAMLNYIRKNDFKGKRVLFWNTYCGEDFSHLIEQIDYKTLPAAVHGYFETPVQELDK